VGSFSFKCPVPTICSQALAASREIPLWHWQVVNPVPLPYSKQATKSSPSRIPLGGELHFHVGYVVSNSAFLFLSVRNNFLLLISSSEAIFFSRSLDAKQNQ
jgi:hypothetical protein